MDLLLSEAMVTDLARQALGDPGATVAGWRVDPVDYDFGTPTTKGAVRLRGPGWSVFVKVIQAYRHWPMLETLPPEMQQRVLGSSLWRHEADLYASELGTLLPPGLRLPTVYDIFELGDDRVAIAMEDVAVADVSWDDRVFADAARLIGRMAVRLTRADALPASASRTPGELSRLLYDFNLKTFVFPALADGRTWAHPLMAASQEPLQRDLAELADRLPDLLEHLNWLPQLMIHGDASPQNLLIPAGAPGTFVAIDWSLGGVAAVGDDLAQLLIGLAHAGQLPVVDLPGIRETIINGYWEGLAEEGFAADRGQVARGLDGALAVRSAFTALPLDRLNEPRSDELDNLLRDRLELTRYLCDLGLSVSPNRGRPTMGE